ncbi:unnamed protein product [Musa acuminata subsp. malaccensis]|uniref:(wild Malaysian banana) hypothetical protein n=1 Tax=Musa acuminata subsp. malaccensis TaxID=214687 RepID=A0A804K928_MUSAM|nr:unnamed protein product [Musa acuminata subsp. malaccensis]
MHEEHDRDEKWIFWKIIGDWSTLKSLGKTLQTK